MQEEERRLIADALAGNHSAFATLTKCYEDRLFNTVFRLLGNLEDAEDVVQETFINAYLKLREFKGDSQFFTWLYRIAMNTAIDRKKQQKGKAAEKEGMEHVEAKVYEVVGEWMEIIWSQDPQPAKQTDLYLIGESLNGNSQALVELLRRYRQDLHHMLAELAVSPGKRAEVGNQVCVNIGLSLKEYQGDVPFVTWLFRIAERTVKGRSQGEPKPKHSHFPPSYSSMTKEERQLLKDAWAGDQAAWDQLIHRYEVRLFNTLLRLLGNEADAKVVLEATFAKAHHSLDEFNGESQFFTRLFRIAMNQAIAYKRKKKGPQPPE